MPKEVGQKKEDPPSVKGARALWIKRSPIFHLIGAIAEKSAKEHLSQDIDSLESLAKAVYEKLLSIITDAANEPGEDLLKAYESFGEDGVTYETVRKHCAPVAKRYNLTRDYGRSRPRHPLRPFAERQIRALLAEKKPAHQIVRAVERSLASLDRRGVSKTTIRKWISEIH